MLPSFALLEPHSVPEAVSLRAELGEAARWYAGGTELLLAMKAGLLECDYLINVKTVDGLTGVRRSPDGSRLLIGAATTHRAVERAPLVREAWPLLAEVEGRIANVRVRAVGTLGGNLGFAEPHTDAGTVLLLYDAVVHAHGRRGPRVVPLADFFLDSFTTALEPDELITVVEVPGLPAPSGAAYVRHSMLERPTLGVGCVIVGDERREAAREVRLALGSVGPRPARLSDAEARLSGAPLDGPAFVRALEEAAELAAAASDPVDDLYGSAAYKQHLVRVLTRRVIEQARARLRGGEA